MRGLIGRLACAVAVGFAGCAHAPPPLVVTEIELQLDEGRPTERPLMPGRMFEVLVLLDPRLTAYRPARLRLLLAQPGHLVLSLYTVDAAGQPGALVATIDRVYGPELVSRGDDGKWIIEDLSFLPERSGPLFVGLYTPEKEGDPRLWGTANDTGRVVQRDADPEHPLARIPRTPVLRLDVAPVP